MTEISADVLKDVLGPQATGPAGFNVHYKVENDANIEAGSTGVEVKLDEASLARARAQNEGGVNKEVAKSLEPKPNTAMGRQAQESAKVDNKYAALADRCGVTAADQKSQRFASRASASLDRRPTRNNYAALSKNPLLRIRQRHLLRLRATFDEIANTKKKTVAINPEILPKLTLEKMAKTALAKGMEMTPVGTVVQTMKLAGVLPKKEIPKDLMKPLELMPAPEQMRNPAVAPAKKRQWALFFNPEMIPSGWATD